ncbi:FkbM family methyltransferase [Spirosoma foliorum]|uniref:FkbM family methyltransferase n=1 Tax=Spirosoma foliorum TaxID=2710596 RepID=A0A7G5GYN0_9BACT|nr:FkbM family methyltransferase [Spirosoma foliorum]QMW03972.1 FkbM family methyltransferase [Spirosoma foliorum]
MRSLLRLLGHQHWLRFGVRDRIIRAFHNPDESRPEVFNVPFYGKIYAGDFSTFLDWSVYYYGAYCGEELSIMKDLLRDVRDPIILDIGANIGHHSLFASTIAKEVHSFEPYPLVLEKLYQKIEINSIDNIIIHEVGLGEREDELPYFPPTDSNTGTGTFMGNAEINKNSLKLPIQIGDDYLSNLHLEKLDYVKMDIEGYEPSALRGLRKSLELYRPIVFFEWSAEGRKDYTNMCDLFPKDYTIFNFISPHAKLGVFSNLSYSLTKGNVVNTNGNKVAIPIDKLYLASSKIRKN